MNSSPLRVAFGRLVSPSAPQAEIRQWITCWGLVALCVGAITLSGCRAQTTTQSADDAETTDVAGETIGSVTVTIVNSDKTASDESAEAREPLFEKSFDVGEGTTLESVMKKIENPGVVISGSGVTAFVQSIGGVETNAERGWTYTIDGEFATEGIGSTELKPGQTVRWRFTSFEEAMADGDKADADKADEGKADEGDADEGDEVDASEASGDGGE
ncbi:DUF4430 domain-containing protein [Rhodopirellula sallentina]|uniref:Transcobalamin-like C-terminal domain-containing protein n=1 Tax=Rhodopirellula sallentina SM41 TaxID=1263870 RepID=M5U0L9_9BACT|nr:DUF4430 domain-containing protein [Rhodopirellula sallentina]EMI55000.1 hypothetical protein RSSM_03564 [Rhodopirellula sallentina SM41]